jgi:sensor histidine kinase YesM
LLTFPFIENAFKYGLQSIGNGFLKIKIFVTKNIFYFFFVNDNEPDTNRKKESSGIGIENVRKRLELLYPNNYQLTIENKTGSFGIQLQINLNNDGKNNMLGSR